MRDAVNELASELNADVVVIGSRNPSITTHLLGSKRLQRYPSHPHSGDGREIKKRGHLLVASPHVQECSLTAFIMLFGANQVVERSGTLAPSPVAMMICLYGTVVQSPAAKYALHAGFTFGIDDNLAMRLRSMAPSSPVVFGNRPICTKDPRKRNAVHITTDAVAWYSRPVTLLPSPFTSRGLRIQHDVDVFQAACFILQNWSAFISGANSSRVTCSTMPAGSIAASTHRLPPPITPPRFA